MLYLLHVFNYPKYAKDMYRDQPGALIDLYTDTAAILNHLDLRSIIGCPGGMSTIRYKLYSVNIYACFSGQFFFRFS